MAALNMFDSRYRGAGRHTHQISSTPPTHIHRDGHIAFRPPCSVLPLESGQL